MRYKTPHFRTVRWAQTHSTLLDTFVANNVDFYSTKVQLNCPSDWHRDYGGILAVEVQFQIRDQFWIPHPKLHGSKYLIFLLNLKTGLLRWFSRKMCFCFLVNRKYTTGVILVRQILLSKKPEKKVFILNYRWYVWAWYYQAYANQLDFLN